MSERIMKTKPIAVVSPALYILMKKYGYVKDGELTEEGHEIIYNNEQK